MVQRQNHPQHPCSVFRPGTSIHLHTKEVHRLWMVLIPYPRHETCSSQCCLLSLVLSPISKFRLFAGVCVWCMYEFVGVGVHVHMYVVSV